MARAKARIDDRARQTRRDDHGRDRDLEAAGGLEHDQLGSDRGQARGELLLGMLLKLQDLRRTITPDPTA